MSRTLKFRAWDKEDKLMFHDVGVGKEGDFIIFGYDADGDVDHWFNALDYEGEGPHPFEITQYTGINDIHGYEIYEKDIVAIRWNNPMTGDDIEDLYKVELVRSGYKLVNVKGKPGEDRYLWMQSERVVVIGNVFEDTHLLEVPHEQS